MKQFWMFAGTHRENLGGLEDGVATEASVDACLRHMSIVRSNDNKPVLWKLRDTIPDLYEHFVDWWYIVDTTTWEIVVVANGPDSKAPRFTTYAQDLKVAKLNEATDEILERIYAQAETPTDGNKRKGVDNGSAHHPAAPPAKT